MASMGSDSETFNEPGCQMPEMHCQEKTEEERRGNEQEGEMEKGKGRIIAHEARQVRAHPSSVGKLL